RWKVVKGARGGELRIEHLQDRADRRVLLGLGLDRASMVLATLGVDEDDARAVGEGGFALDQFEPEGAPEVVAGRLFDLRADLGALMQLVVRKAAKRRRDPQDPVGEADE